MTESGTNSSKEGKLIFNFSVSTFAILQREISPIIREKKTDIGVDETGSKSSPRFSSEQSFERRRVVVLFV